MGPKGNFRGFEGLGGLKNGAWRRFGGFLHLGLGLKALGRIRGALFPKPAFQRWDLPLVVYGPDAVLLDWKASRPESG